MCPVLAAPAPDLRAASFTATTVVNYEAAFPGVLSFAGRPAGTVDLDLHTRYGQAEPEYKYVVRNEDGTPTVWKPGSNLQLPLHSSGGGGLPQALRVSDAWDESWRSIEARHPCRLCQVSGVSFAHSFRTGGAASGKHNAAVCCCLDV